MLAEKLEKGEDIPELGIYHILSKNDKEEKENSRYSNILNSVITSLIKLIAMSYQIIVYSNCLHYLATP